MRDDLGGLDGGIGLFAADRFPMGIFNADNGLFRLGSFLRGLLSDETTALILILVGVSARKGEAQERESMDEMLPLSVRSGVVAIDATLRGRLTGDARPFGILVEVEAVIEIIWPLWSTSPKDYDTNRVGTQTKP